KQNKSYGIWICFSNSRKSLSGNLKNRFFSWHNEYSLKLFTIIEEFLMIHLPDECRLDAVQDTWLE
ncbi:TPA: hypothetical protein ACFOTI_002159, partial [Neisseria meningitidis]